MTYAPFITSQTVLTTTQEDIHCALCRKIAQVCDGKLTLQEIARLVYLPLAICQKLVVKGLNHNWFTLAPAEVIVTNTENFWTELQVALELAAGDEGKTILNRAVKMIGQQPEELCGAGITDLLIAVELQLSEGQRQQLTRQLDLLRQQYTITA